MKWSRGDLINFLVLLVAVAGLLVPELRHLIGLPTAAESSAHPSPQPTLNSSPQAGAKTSRIDSIPSSSPQNLPPDATSHVTQRKQPVLQEVTVILYNDANDPTFSVDDRPTRPTRYASGIATFSLPEGTHVIRAEYPARTCSATVSVPLPEPGSVPANCSLKRTGGA